MRFSKKEEVVDNVIVPEGAAVLPNLVCANRNKDDFGEDSHDWKPERYLDISTPPHVSFGVGPRSCIGKRLAMSILRQWTADIVSSFQISRVQDTKLELVGSDRNIRVTHPKAQLDLLFTQRQ